MAAIICEYFKVITLILQITSRKLIQNLQELLKRELAVKIISHYYLLLGNDILEL